MGRYRVARGCRRRLGANAGVERFAAELEAGSVELVEGARDIGEGGVEGDREMGALAEDGADRAGSAAGGAELEEDADAVGVGALDQAREVERRGRLFEERVGDAIAVELVNLARR